MVLVFVELFPCVVYLVDYIHVCPILLPISCLCLFHTLSVYTFFRLVNHFFFASLFACLFFLFLTASLLCMTEI